MTRSKAVAILARHLDLNSGRIAALAQRLGEAGEIPKGCGRSVPSLSHASLGKLLITAIGDRGLGNAAASTKEFAALRSDGGAALLDLLMGLMSGVVAVSGVHSIIVQLEPAAVTIVNSAGRLQYGPERSQDGASRIITIPGDTLRKIIDEFRALQAA
jgi:hypothetical protein